MSRHRRMLTIVVLLIFLLSLWTYPLNAREPKSNLDDWQITTYGENFDATGDDDDHGMHIVILPTSLLLLLWQSIRWLY